LRLRLRAFLGIQRPELADTHYHYFPKPGTQN
jgi:hypothetical protein